jgi:hypothetical protein
MLLQAFTEGTHTLKERFTRLALLGPLELVTPKHGDKIQSQR